MLDGAAHGADALALDPEFRRVEGRTPVSTWSSPRRMEHDGRRGRLLRMSCTGKDKARVKKSRDAWGAGQSKEVLHDTRICASAPSLSRADAAMGWVVSCPWRQKQERRKGWPTAL